MVWQKLKKDVTLPCTNLKHRRMASYWTRKDDQSDELRTIKPWEEAVSNGDKVFPDPKGKS
ncbi:MAG: hypothetical protein HUK20_02105 [Fibrobacter sp.]|nr:hypothetical protein [Fibrobacter sp.]